MLRQIAGSCGFPTGRRNGRPACRIGKTMLMDTQCNRHRACGDFRLNDKIRRCLATLIQIRLRNSGFHAVRTRCGRHRFRIVAGLVYLISVGDCAVSGIARDCRCLGAFPRCPSFQRYGWCDLAPYFELDFHLPLTLSGGIFTFCFRGSDRIRFPFGVYRTH